MLIGDSGYGVDVAERAPFRATLPMWSTPYETTPNADLRASNRKIVPLCPFADTYIRERPEEQDLLA
ncbi:MAG: hypothetical protein EBY52_01655 [Actinobacteria bacterium]|nr:hypothetical protein [Actinomycetota bacterium]